MMVRTAPDVKVLTCVAVAFVFDPARATVVTVDT